MLARRAVRSGMSFLCLAGIVGVALAAGPPALKSSPEQIERGRYLVTVGGCNDCHSPKLMSPKGPLPNPLKVLSGHPEDAKLPEIPKGVIEPGKWGALTNADLTAWVGPWGVSFAANLTPDPATGIGAWTEETFIKTIRTGKHMGTGRNILPPMPWDQYARMTDDDLKAVFAYLHSLKAVRNVVPQPIPAAASSH
jgi:mono/diheme cytochrome c family protein